MQFQRLSFTNSQGVKLAARLDLPLDEKPAAFAIFAHCFTCTKNFNAVVNIDRALAREGIAVLRFDFTGLGESEGQFAETNLSTNISDIVSAAEFLGSHYEAPQLLIGHSLGGAAILQAASQIPSATAVATIAAPFDLTHIASFFEDNWRDIETKGEAEVNLAGKKFNIRKQFIENLERTHMEETIRSLKKALVVFHSPVDEIVSIDNAAKIFQAARHPKSFISLDKSDHLLSNRSDSIYTGMVLAAWVRKYIDLPRKDQQGRDLHDNRIVVRTGRHGYRTEITANGHSLIADEPIAVGGADTGPTPYDYLVTALGACTSMTLRMYADRKAWPLESIVVRLRHRKIHSDDCQDCESRAGSMDLIEREIELDGPLDKGQRERLLDIADKCPVHRTLHSGVRVKSWLKDQNIGGSSENY